MFKDEGTTNVSEDRAAGYIIIIIIILNTSVDFNGRL